MKINEITPKRHILLQRYETIAKPPKSLYFIGQLPTEKRLVVAIVGSRKPTAYGKEVTHRLGYELAQRGVIIVSGLALGIDSIAHEATLAANGLTLAILGNGLPEIYPSRHAQLAQRIIRGGGAIISEYGTGMPALAHNFLERNRLVSGLADAVVIVEAAQRSGTLNTAAHALEQGRELCIVPGNITSPLSQGCNALLKQGAHPITSAEDILEVISPGSTIQAKKPHPKGETVAEQRLLELFAQGIRSGGTLYEKSALAAPEFQYTMTMLELKGVIRNIGGNQWRLE